MDLHQKWDWDNRKLPCKVKVESGNPAADELRARLREIAQRLALSALDDEAPTGAGGPELLSSGGAGGGGPSSGGAPSAVGGGGSGADKSNKKAVRLLKLDSDAALAKALANAPNAPVRNAEKLIADVEAPPLSRTAMNLNKRFLRVPKSPPKKVMMDLQRERLIRSAEGARNHDDGGNAHFGGVGVGVGVGGTTGDLLHDDKVSQQQRRRKDRDKGKSSPDTQASAPGTGKAVTEVFKPYKGDLFASHGNYMGGMVYLSRMPNHVATIDLHNLSATMAKEDSAKADDVPVVPAHGGASWDALTKERDAKLTCATTICGWSKHQTNVERLAKEGALEAIMRLAKEDDRKIRRYCASTFRHMSTKAVLCKQMISIGALPIISELSSSSRNKQISRDCAIAMLNMTRMQGREGHLVDDGAVLALMSLMNENEDLAGLCARGLFNLTCVDAPYPFIERVIKSFLGLASAATLEVKHICASALCNLSDLKAMRLRLVEEGVVQVLGLLARGAEAKTRRVCAIVLQSLASEKKCRQEMVQKGAVQVLYSLSNDNDANTLHYIASAMMRLALDPANCQRMVNESGVSALCNICMRCPDMPKTTQPCAAAFQVLSRQESAKVTMVAEQCVPAIVTLLRNSSDTNTLQFCLLALCNLLTLEENHLPVLQQGGVMSIIDACKNEQGGVRESCALALFNLSCGEVTKKSVVAAGAVPAIMRISKLNDLEAQTRCAATLCNFAGEKANIARMVEDGVIPTFIDLLKTGQSDTVKHCCAALCQLAQDPNSCEKIVELGAVPHIVAGVESGDNLTKQSCCSVLSALSFQAQCRQKLCTMGALSALISLAKIDDRDTSLRCALAFANLSCEATVQGMMIDQGVLPILKMLSNSYSEDNQLFVAKALANLSCHVGTEQLMIDQDCVSVLMMIGMVRSVQNPTKQVCAKALHNLLSEKSQQRLCEEGLISTMSSFSKLDDEPTMKVCASVFNFLSRSPYGRSKLVEKKAALFGLIGLSRSKDRSTQVTVGKTVCNLLSFQDSQRATVEVGAIEKLEKIATLGDVNSETNCANAFFLISGSQQNREMMVNVNAVKIVVLLSRSPNLDTRWSSIKCIANLSQYPDMRESLLENNVVLALVALTEEAKSLSEEVLAVIAQAFCNLSLVEEFAGRMVQEGVVEALIRIHSRFGGGGGVVAHFISGTLRSLASCTETVSMLVRDRGVELLLQMCNIALPQWTSSVYYDACVACYRISIDGDSRKSLIERGGLEIIGKCEAYPPCHEYCVAMMFLLSLNGEYRVACADGASGSLLIKISAIEPDTAMTQNAAHALFMLSKNEKSRNLLVDAGLPAALVKLCKSGNDTIRSSASQALKNLSSEGGDGLEEGTVSALIAMSEGATDNTVSNFDASSLLKPRAVTVDAKKYLVDKEILPSLATPFSPLTVVTTREPGGDASANKGPAAPLPPPMAGQHVPHAPVVDEEVEQRGEEEENLDKVMMFAKMSVPPELENDDSMVVEDEVPVSVMEKLNINGIMEDEQEEKKDDGGSGGGGGATSPLEGGAKSGGRMSMRQNNGGGRERKNTIRSGRSSPASPPMPVRTEQASPAVGGGGAATGGGGGGGAISAGPKEKQARARRRRRQDGTEEDIPFDQQANSMGLY